MIKSFIKKIDTVTKGIIICGIIGFIAIGLQSGLIKL